MNLLLDTHAFIWWDAAPERLPPRVLTAIESRSNLVYISLVSLWEIQIKVSLGKLSIRRPLEDLVREQQRGNQMALLPIEFPHILALGKLPELHRDPFDRLLVAQAQIEHLTLVSRDPLIGRYDVQVFWD